METTAQSGDSDIAEELLRFFVEQKEKECFAAMLYTCYEFIKPDVALEVTCVAELGTTRATFAAAINLAGCLHALQCMCGRLTACSSHALEGLTGIVCCSWRGSTA